MLSPTASLLFRPFRAYEELARGGDASAPTVVGGAFRLLFVVGAFVAITTTGRLAPIEHALAMGSFAWVPVIQLLALGVALRVVTARAPLRRAFALHLAGQGPAMVVLLLFAFLALVVPAASTATILLRVVPPLLVAALGWGALLRYACFRSALALSRARAAVATVVYTLVLLAIVLAYFFAMGQLRPILP